MVDVMFQQGQRDHGCFCPLDVAMARQLRGLHHVSTCAVGSLLSTLPRSFGSRPVAGHFLDTEAILRMVVFFVAIIEGRVCC